jgi:hypothetical protein
LSSLSLSNGEKFSPSTNIVTTYEMGGTCNNTGEIRNPFVWVSNLKGIYYLEVQEVDGRTKQCSLVSIHKMVKVKYFLCLLYYVPRHEDVRGMKV